MVVEDPIVLLVDDSEFDALLMRTAFEHVGLLQPLRFAAGGDEAIAYLRGDGLYHDRKRFPLPTVVLLDLNMPGRNGFEVLVWIREQPSLKRLRVYILSASSQDADVQRAYDVGANSYLVKPGNLDGLMHLARCLVAWLRLCHFAPVTDAGESREFAGAEGTAFQTESARGRVERA